MSKIKICPFCKKEVKAFWKAKTRDRDPCCKNCLSLYNEKYEKETKKVGGYPRTGSGKPREPSKNTAYSTIKQKPRKPTGEYKLFLSIYAQRNGKCEVTGELIPFDVSSFAHILSKGAYPRYRLNPDNIIMVKPDIHSLYDNSSQEKLLSKYPNAIIIYDRKAQLKYQYYNE